MSRSPGEREEKEDSGQVEESEEPQDEDYENPDQFEDPPDIF